MKELKFDGDKLVPQFSRAERVEGVHAGCTHPEAVAARLDLPEQS